MNSESIPEYKIILASNSSIRQKILEDSGISFEVVPSEVEEEELKQSLSGNNFREYCLTLAKAKALDVSKKRKCLCHCWIKYVVIEKKFLASL